MSGGPPKTQVHGLYISWGTTIKRIGEAKLVGWKSLEASWQVDREAIEQRMREAGLRVPDDPFSTSYVPRRPVAPRPPADEQVGDSDE